MAGQVDLPLWPSTIDCIDWSEDNIIAFAGGDSIGILTPRYGDHSGSRWNSTIVKANAFTAEEVPLCDLLTFRNFSIGEEISTRQVQALKWSARGLGKHGRCVLAVLSSNHVLSIWENVGKPGSSVEWSRVFVVNHALREHYSDMERLPEQTQTEFNERQVVAQRVRAFSWSPPLYDDSRPNGKIAAWTDHGDQLLAVSTENGDILLLRILSPHDLLSPGGTAWSVEVMQRFNTTEAVIEALSSQDSADNNGYWNTIADDIHVADHLAWGPRNHTGSKHRSSLAFIARRRLFNVTSEHKFEDNRSQVTLLHHSCRNALSPRSDLTGPLLFVPETQFVVAFAADAVFCVDCARSFNDDNNSTYHHLDGRWDEITGIAFSHDSRKGLQLHMASLLSSSTARTATLSLPLDEEEAMTQPPWQAAIVRLKADFSDQHKLGGHVQDRVWGVAASPMLDLIATATVVLPSDTINYVTQAEQFTSINITHLARSSKELLPADGGTFLSSRASTSVMLFGLMAALDDNGYTQRDDALVEAMQHFAKLPEGWSVICLDQSNVRELQPIECVRYLRERLFLAPDIRSTRFKLIADLACKAVNNAEEITKLVIRQLVNVVLQLLSDAIKADELSQRIYSAHQTLGSRLNGADPAIATSNSHSEVCQICGEAIAFESVKWARCAKGHQFTRCGLTFLAMQQPGLSKSCGICGVQYVDEYQLLDTGRHDEPRDIQMTDLRDAQEEQNEQAPEDETLDRGWVHVGHGAQPAKSGTSLARILFAAFDRCVYCGGTF